MKKDVSTNQKWTESVFSPAIEVQAELAYPLYPTQLSRMQMQVIHIHSSSTKTKNLFYYLLV